MPHAAPASRTSDIPIQPGVGPAAGSPRTPAGPLHAQPPHAGRRRWLGLSHVQVGAGAFAAVISALAASFIGVAGTLIGAAVGSIVSTVAAEFYSRSVERAGNKLRDTPLLPRPTTGPAVGSVSAATSPALAETQVVLQSDAPDTQVSRTADAAEALLIRPDAQPPAGPVPDPQAAASATDGFPGSPTVRAAPAAPSAGNPPDDGTLPSEPTQRRRHGLLTLIAVGLAGFGIAIAGITAAEVFLDRPLSGGGSGTSVGRAVTGDSGSSTEESDTGTSQESPTADPTDQADASAEPSAPTADPSAPAGSDPAPSGTAPTAGPTQSVAPSAPPTATSSVSGSVSGSAAQGDPRAL